MRFLIVVLVCIISGCATGPVEPVVLGPKAVDLKGESMPAGLVQSYPKMILPQKAAERGIKGSVKLAYDILPEGQTVNVSAIGGQNMKYFERSAISTLKKFRYVKSEHGYKNVTYTFSYDFGR